MNLFPDGYEDMTPAQRANWHSSQAWRYARNARRGAWLAVVSAVVAVSFAVAAIVIAVQVKW